MKQIDAFGKPTIIAKRRNRAEEQRALKALWAGYRAQKKGEPWAQTLLLGCFEARTESEHSFHVKAFRYGFWMAEKGKTIALKVPDSL